MIIAVSISANAQYKKASFLQRGHKNYGLTAGMKFFGDGLTATPSFRFTYGNDKGKNRIFHWWDLDYTLGGNYSYTAPSSNGGTARVNGKTSGYLSIVYNWAVYLMDNKNDDNKVLPFLKLGLAAGLTNRKYINETVTPSTASPDRYTNFTSSFGYDGGAGVVYKINDRINFIGSGGYRFELTDQLDDESYYYVIKNHPYVNVGIRILIKGEDD
jgi:hypothetical protein